MSQPTSDNLNQTLFSDDDLRFMQRANELAQKAESLNEVPVGAVVVLDGKIIGEGFNQPIQQHDPSAHAEIVAIRQAGAVMKNYRLPGTTLYVTLEPCTMCAMAMIHARVERVVFAAADLKTGAAGSVFDVFAAEEHNHRVLVENGLLAQTCSERLSAFFKRRRAEKKAQKQSRSSV